jgi:hypothetical protein
MASQEAGPHERQPKMLKGELESNTRKPRDLVKKSFSESLKKGQLPFITVRWSREMMLMMMMILMWWEPVCHKTKWQQHFVERKCSSGLGIYSSLHISDRWNVGVGGYLQSTQHI